MERQVARHRWVYGLNEYKEAKETFAKQGVTAREILGGKGLGLAEMSGLGLPVSQGFIVTTEACNHYFDAGGILGSDIWDQIEDALKALQIETGKQLGNPDNPLIVSCRSGARASMPGMMDTVLNIGLNRVVVEGLIQSTGSPSFAYDLYRRLIQMFASVVMRVDDEPFQAILSRINLTNGAATDAGLSSEQWHTICHQFETLGELVTAIRRETSKLSA